MKTQHSFAMKLACIPLLIFGMHAMADTIDTIGQEPYEQCGYCHEYDGNSLRADYPRLAGQTAEYIAKQLNDFRSGKRESVMQATAELLSDEDIQVIAEYFSKQAVITRHTHELAAGESKQAEQIVHRGDEKRNLPACTGCHQTRTLGSGTTPRLAGQHRQYLAGQLQAFKNGGRSNDPGGQMAAISRRLSDGEINLVAAYLAQIKEDATMTKANHAKK